MIGIYKITNKINGKCYIGQSTDINDRWIKHRSRPFQINDGSYDTYLYRSIRKYGLDNFIFEVIEECSCDELNEREIFYIDFYNSHYTKCGYNMTFGGEGGIKRDNKKICDMWDEGHTISKIAQELHCSRNTVKNALKQFGKYDADEIKNRWIKKTSNPVNQYDMNFNLLKTWQSAKQVEKELGIDHSGIGDCCNYITKQAGGFKWRYAERSETAALADLLD